MEGFFRRLYIELYYIFHNYASQWKFEYPFVVQMAAGCELHSGEAKEGFVWFAYQGSDLLNFQNYSWLPSPKGGTGAQQVCGLFNQDPVDNEITHRHISDTCPRFLLGLLDAGKADLQRQVRPEAWLSIGPNPGSDHRMLICHVSGFYPKPIWAMWMRGEQVQQGTQRRDVLPNADGTWYLRIYLNVETIERSGLSCRVRHSSLGGKDIILYLAFQGPTSFHVILILSFANSTWAQNQGLSWLHDLQIHGWDSDSGTTIFLKPWSKGNFSDEEVTELKELFLVYLIGFIRVIQDHVNPFEIQGIAGCELHSGEATVNFLRGALGGLDFLSLKNDSRVPVSESSSMAQHTQNQGIYDTIEKLLLETCPRYLLGVLNVGKAELQRQVKSKAWLSSGLSCGPGLLLLVYHVSGFYSKPAWVMWMRGEHEQPGTQQGDILPKADGT
ncbi:T-cell surface glycoprotein CD1b-1 [Pteropus alecto]|uniref:T-cell surface glycoprotein CD1b-1 n=1 Tax=Pteropus alecto TaxID=9402 RepID=L5K361_PTEAL|nr:T-cell surface glycoprotein CD1b-1 [Pteropus alecto]